MPEPEITSEASLPLRYFSSSPEVIRLVVIMYVRSPLSFRNDHVGDVLESHVKSTRDKAAALPLIEKALKHHGSPEAITNDGLRSYWAAPHELGNIKKQEVGRYANNRVENSPLPFQRRERAVLRFRRMKTLQKSASVRVNVHNHFNLARHLAGRQTCKLRRSATLAEWQNLMA